MFEMTRNLKKLRPNHYLPEGMEMTLKSIEMIPETKEIIPETKKIIPKSYAIRIDRNEAKVNRDDTINKENNTKSIYNQNGWKCDQSQ